MHKTLFGKEPAALVLEEVKRRIADLGRPPRLAIVQMGENPSSELYVGKKIKKANEIGIEAELFKLSEQTSEAKLLELVEKLNNDSSIDGFIIQLPLPKHIDSTKIIESISPEKDVDGFTSTNIGKLVLGLSEDSLLLPATPSGIIQLLEFYKIQLEGKRAVVVGRSNIVGKPISAMLLNRNATVTICHSKTKNIREHTLDADIVIAAVGKPGLITADMIKQGACVIDVGTTKVGDKTKGDADYDSILKKANCTPVPGGVGPMTVAMLLMNTLKAAEKRG